MTANPDDESLLDFGPTRLIKGHGPPFRLPLAERLRAARRVPQAVVKVVSFLRGAKRLGQLMDYISREGQLALETESGERIETRDEQKDLAQAWASGFDHRKRSRDAVHLVFSMPPGSDPTALRNAVRTVITRQFAGHRAVFGIHEDRRHPHAHVVVAMRGRERKLEFRKTDLYRLREVFAEAAREEGVPLAASPRAARGVGRKGIRQPVHHLRVRGLAPQVYEQAVQEFAEDSRQGASREKSWEKAIRRRHALEKQIYLDEARRLREAAQKEAALSKPAFLRAAQDLEAFAQTMPAPKTRRMTWLDQIHKSSGSGSPQQDPTRDRSPER